MGFLFNEFVYRPIYNLLIFTYNIVPLHDFGIAIILVTIIIKLILLPLSRKQIESQKKMQELQPKIKEIQDKYKNDKEKQSRALMEFYKENKANPFSGCLPMVFQLVFLIAIYRVLFNISKNGLMVNSSDLYLFMHNPGQIKHLFLGLIDLSSIVDFKSLSAGNIAHIILVIAAAGAQYIQTKMLMATKSQKDAKLGKKDDKNPDFAQVMSKQMLYLAPIMTLFIGIKFPAGLALYWLVSTLFMIAQQEYLEKLKNATAVKL
ncbi:MAG: YidC/Oxa1 family membrane protein insertase [Candidatus Moranbacteria bacterium]|nr:YidC/Oxa1 family membrane protein insertase [Candidatus Moranbacteria bacterium]